MEPIERVPFTTPSINKDVYTVPGRGTYAWPPPEFANDITLLVGGRVVATDDEIYPWELNDDGYVVFTGKQPLENETIIMQVSQEAVFLDLNKLKFPKGYNLDARVFNRTLFDALYTSNKMWMYGHDAIQAWSDSNNIPDATSYADDYILTSQNGIWTPTLPAIVKSILGLNTGDDVVANDLSALTSVSSTELSAANFHCDTLSSTYVSGVPETGTIRTWGNIIDNEALQNVISFSNDDGNIVIEGANPAGVMIDASSAIALGDGAGPIQCPSIGASGYYSYPAKVGYTDGDLPDYFTDSKNIYLVSQYPPVGFTGFQTHKLKADNVPNIGIYGKLNELNLDFDAYTNDTVRWNAIRKYVPDNYSKSNPSAGDPRITSAHIFYLTQTTGLSNLLPENRWVIRPHLFLRFSKTLFKDLDGISIENGQDKYHVQGTGTIMMTDSATPANNTVKNFYIDNSRIHFIGSQKYSDIMSKYRQSQVAGENGDNYFFPTGNTDTAATLNTDDPYTYAVVDLFRDSYNETIFTNSIVLKPNDENTEQFTSVAGTKTLNGSFSILITLKGDTYFS